MLKKKKKKKKHFPFFHHFYGQFLSDMNTVNESCWTSSLISHLTHGHDDKARLYTILESKRIVVKASGLTCLVIANTFSTFF